MLTIRNTGSIADVISAVHDVPKRLVPYAAATALTRTAKRGQASLIASMQQVFDRPTPYALNGTFVQIATKDNLTARIAVKNDSASGIRAENFLSPEVEGGPRREKRFEAAFRLAGIMLPSERAMPGAGIKQDAYGNVTAATIRNILANVGKGDSKTKLFSGAIGRKRQRGIWQRDGHRIKPLFIFTRTQPSYRARFDFTAVAEQAAKQYFTDEFYTALSVMIDKGQP